MTWHDSTWLDSPVWHCTCAKIAMSQHPGSHFLIINSVLCKNGNDNCEQLVHWREFGSKCLDASRQHRSDNESGDDTISAAIWEDISVQSNYLSVWKECVYVEEYEGFSSEQSTNIPNSDLSCGCHFHRTIITQVHMEMISVTWSTEFDHVWPQEGPGDEVILASVCNWTQWYWHETMLQSMCFVVGLISGSLVSFESSLFRWMCNLLQLPILKCFLGLNRILVTRLRCKTTHHTWWQCRCNCQLYHWPIFLWWNC